MTIKPIFQMACILRLECNLFNGYFRCLLPVETVDVEVKVKMMQGIHMFITDHKVQSLEHKAPPLPLPHPEDEDITRIRG